MECQGYGCRYHQRQCCLFLFLIVIACEFRSSRHASLRATCSSLSIFPAAFNIVWSLYYADKTKAARRNGKADRVPACASSASLLFPHVASFEPWLTLPIILPRMLSHCCLYHAALAGFPLYAQLFSTPLHRCHRQMSPLSLALAPVRPAKHSSTSARAECQQAATAAIQPRATSLLWKTLHL